ncbi:MAG TPA: 4-(cytidine 5'-diphospho)-2-C-methyl-D-erythritol kinase [Thermoanaerobaculia bacterium]|nr:4-(cytidine 5'-diphospho)-2-C-methyl-D-erythritol kinase [Thermoanaerobaculia bacterium]HUM31014.1 4-(cytidine 5'-diphospho)-2-C-methyl-D-erythritol kinase [Thermoanaerobaculia bacterium]HXK69312.1 4-(cytidine 5'-diphospho)-2-C-methyl-D-erythritol kinase [Thermoanaerobaculia bacterium]
MKPVSVQARAKINLFLQVRGLRPDGYHEIYSLFQEISLADTLVFHEQEWPVLRVFCPGVDEEDNLVFKAARLIQPYAAHRKGIRIDIEKKIPMGGGLGGGSSDAAAALRQLNQIWSCGLDETSLMDLGSRLGSDVPFFLKGGSALARGRGESLTYLDHPPLQGPFVIFTPPLALSTPAVYRALGLHPGTMEPEDPALHNFLEGNDIFPLRNDLYRAALRVAPELKEFYAVLEEDRPDMLLMTGSGSSFWAVYPPSSLEKCTQKLTKRGQISIVEPVH